MRRRRTMFVVAPVLVALVISATYSTLAPVPAASQQRGSKATRTTRTTAPPTAARQRQIAKEIESLRSHIEEASAEEGRLLERLEAVAARRKALDRRLAQLDAELTRAETELDQANLQLAAVHGDLLRAEAKLADTKRGLGEARRELARRAAEAYMHPPVARAIGVMFETQSFRELAANSGFVGASLAAQREVIDRYVRLRDRFVEERAGLDTSRADVAAQLRVIDARRDHLAVLRVTQAAVRAQAVSEEAAQRALLAEVRAKVDEFETAIAALQRESATITRLLKERQRDQGVTPSGKGVLAVPVDGPITSKFGPRKHPVYGTTRMHNGIDFGAPSGRPIRASAAGVVVLAEVRGGYGNTVVIDHGKSLATLYAHQSRIAVRRGERVTRGEVIGYVGSTGMSTGPHLHFEVRVNGSPVDPMDYL